MKQKRSAGIALWWPIQGRKFVEKNRKRGSIMVYVLLVLGFVLLIKGADFFVEASSSVARMLRVPSIIIGLTIVAFGTSAPELAVSTTASLAGNTMAWPFPWKPW